LHPLLFLLAGNNINKPGLGWWGEKRLELILKEFYVEV